MATVSADRHLAGGHAHDHAHAHEIGFVRKYVFSMDHKVIGIQFLFTSLLLMVVGGLLALGVRWQIAWPFDISQPLPGARLIEDFFTASTQATIIPGDFYNMLFTMHATFMIFFVIIPILVGAFGNILIPLQIGARDMAFPLLNMLSYWVALAGGVVMIASFFLETNDALRFTEAPQAGWTSYPPISTAASFASPSLGQSLWLMSLLIVGTSSLMGAVNYITTILNLRAPGMTLFRMPLTTWSLFITSILILMSTPVLTAALLMLIFDRHFGTSFFIINDQVRAGATLSALDSGQPLLYQHLFWFYSHPAVYIMILPAMGITSDILSTFSRKPIFGYKPMVFAIAGIAFLGFIVWGHHMFASGMNPILGTTFMASTMMIALPSAIKVFNWLGTIWGGQIRFTPAMLFALGFVSMFVIGGLSGIFMANAPVDIYFHDTYFIVGHIHYVLFGGSMLGIFAGIYYWYPKMFGRNLNQSIGVLHFWLTLISFNLTFFLMHIIGIGGHPRRYATILEYPTLEFMQPLNVAMSIGALMLGMAQIPFVINVFSSLGRFGNRLVIYPLILVILEFTPLGVMSWVWGVSQDLAVMGALPALILMTLAVIMVLVLIDMLIASVIAWDRKANAVLAGATWVAAIPLFMIPVFVKGDFWEWIGVNSVTYRIDADEFLRAPLQPYPMEVDMDQMSESALLRYDDAERADEAVLVPAVTAVKLNFSTLYEQAAAQGIDLSASPLAEAIEETHDGRDLTITVSTATLDSLTGDLKTAAEASVLQVPAWIAEVRRQDIIPNHTVSRSWKSKATGEFRLVAFTSMSTGWMLVGVSALFGLALLLINRKNGLEFGEPVGSNPWRANSLEWCATSPPWYENFPEIPTVYRGPYEFSSPVTEEDYLPQWEKLPEGVVEPSGH
ncbi:MAG: cbb3-type cytochrome c oxidase subunit I [Phycisphaerales bacterium]